MLSVWFVALVSLVPVSSELPVLTLLALESDLAPWEKHCGCSEPYKPATWGIQVAWTCPVPAQDAQKPECGIQCYNEKYKMISTLCPKDFKYLDCECRYVLPGVEPPQSTNPSPVAVRDWAPISGFTLCARACLQEPSIRRFGTNGYVCKLNTSVSTELLALCFSGCGATEAQLQDYSKDSDFTPLHLQDLPQKPDNLTPLVFLCPNKRSQSCVAPEYCLPDFCASGENPQTFPLSRFAAHGNGTVSVVADSDNTRILIGQDAIETYLGFVKCDGRLPQACIDQPPFGKPPPCPCHVSFQCMARYVRVMAHVMMEFHAQQTRRRPAGEQFRVLVIGFGSSLTSIVAQRLTRGQIDSVDIEDRMLNEVAIPFFGYDALDPTLHFDRQDCLEAVQLRAKVGRDYDVVLVDAFMMDGTVPPQCRSRDFFDNVKAILAARKGILIQNIWTRHEAFPQVRQSYEAVLADYRDVFAHTQELGFNVFPPSDVSHQVLLVGGFVKNDALEH